MRIVVMGASGRTGGHLVKVLVGNGHEVTVLGRRAPEGWTGAFVNGAVDDAGVMARALAGADAAISCLASGRKGAVCLPATHAVIAAAPKGFRYLVVAGAAVNVPGDAKGLADKIIGGIFGLVAGRMLAERQQEYETLAASGLRFSMLRPPRLTDGPGTGRWQVSYDRPRAMQIDRIDLARALAEALGRDDMVGRAPFVAAAPAA